MKTFSGLFKINMTNIDEIRKVKIKAEKELLKLSGVTAVDVGYKYIGGKKTDILAILVYVEKKKDVSNSQMIPGLIDNIPTDIIERRFTLHSGQ